MYDHHIEEMVEALVDSGLTTNKAGAKAVLESYWQDKIADTWNVEDVLSHAQFIGVEITEDEALDILFSVLNDFDASVGINWDVIETGIRNR